MPGNTGKIRETPGGEGGGILDKSSFIILSILRGNGADSRLSGMTALEVSMEEDLGVALDTVYRKIRRFEQAGYVGKGMKDGKANTYYITQEGLGRLEKERNWTDEA